MRILFFGFICFLFVSLGSVNVINVVRFLQEAHAAGISYYVAPSGSDTSCTHSRPCSLNTGLSKAVSGDEIVLMNGTYTTALITKRDGVTFRAENRHNAIIHPTDVDRPIRIDHSNTVIRSLVVDGRGYQGSSKVGAGLAVRPFGGEISNVTIEDNILRHGPLWAGLGAQNLVNSIFRFNIIEDAPNEGMYIGSSSCCAVRNSEFYGNVVRRSHGNMIDIKITENLRVHHNIFEEMQNNGLSGGDGCVIISGFGHNIHDNIVRNAKCGTAPLEYVGVWGGHTIRNNVFSKISSSAAIWYQRKFSQTDGHGEAKIHQNTFCGLSSYTICERHGTCGTAPAGISISNNTGLPNGAPQSACDAEVNRIINEMKILPGVIDKSSLPLEPPVISRK